MILFYYADLPIRDIAARLGSNSLAVRANLSRGRGRLRHFWVTAMDDLRHRFATLDRVPVPDVWSDVERRLEALGTAAPTRPSLPSSRNGESRSVIGRPGQPT